MTAKLATATTPNFTRAGCLGTFEGVAEDIRSDPASGEGYYYLAKGLDVCVSSGYGEAHGVAPDPRRNLRLFDPCP